MTEKEEAPKVTVTTTDIEDDGRVTAKVRWSATPELDYSLVLTPEGRLVEFTARAREGSAVAATRLRRAPLGEMQAAVRASVVDALRLLRRELTETADLDEQGHAKMRPGWRDEPGGPRPFETRPANAAEKRWWAQERRRFEKAAASFDRASADQRLAATAALYADLFAQGAPRPYDQLAADLGISKKSAQNRIYQARERGFLTSEGKGKLGGVLRPKAKRLLAGKRG